jgi:hypothetical protein
MPSLHLCYLSKIRNISLDLDFDRTHNLIHNFYTIEIFSQNGNAMTLLTAQIGNLDMFTNNWGQSGLLKSVRSIAPLLDRVLVQRIKADAKTAGGIFLPEYETKMASG